MKIKRVIKAITRIPQFSRISAPQPRKTSMKDRPRSPRVKESKSWALAKAARIIKAITASQTLFLCSISFMRFVGGAFRPPTLYERSKGISHHCFKLKCSKRRPEGLHGHFKPTAEPLGHNSNDSQW